jgi:flagellar biosynthesis protein FlhB
MEGQGDIAVILFFTSLLLGSVAYVGIFFYNVFSTLDLDKINCAKGFNCTSNNIFGPGKECDKIKCVTNGIFGGLVNGCCKKGASDQSMDTFSIIILIFGFVVILIGIISLFKFLYSKKSKEKQKLLA